MTTLPSKKQKRFIPRYGLGIFQSLLSCLFTYFDLNLLLFLWYSYKNGLKKRPKRGMSTPSGGKKPDKVPLPQKSPILGLFPCKWPLFYPKIAYFSTIWRWIVRGFSIAIFPCKRHLLICGWKAAGKFGVDFPCKCKTWIFAPCMPWLETWYYQKKSDFPQFCHVNDLYLQIPKNPM
jgi:hypothetical protein